MEQRLDSRYLRADAFERAGAIALAAAGLGLGIFLTAWGISSFWHYTPPEIVVRVANPEVHVVQDRPLTISQDKPVVLAQPDPLKVEHGVKAERAPNLPIDPRSESDRRTASGDVIRREVTVFSQVQHDGGIVVTGWNYRDGSGGTPVSQFCYYTSRNQDQSSRRVDLAVDGVRRQQIGSELVPDIEGAVSKCQWWQS